MADESHKEVARSAEAFATDFHKKVASKEDGNFVSSSLSAHVVLSMATYGADGSTREHMHKALHLPAEDEVAHKGFHGFVQALNNVPKVILRLANKIYVSNDINIKNGFKQITSEHFHSESDVLDFKKAAEAVKVVNKWCIDKTNGKITEIFSESEVTEDTKLILLNAVYFKGSWKDKFHEGKTTLKPFHVNESTTVQVPTMQIEKKFYYKFLKEYNAECVALPYENEDLSMIIIAPKDLGGLQKIEENLDKIDLNLTAENNFYRKKLVLSLPKFKVETTIDLNQHLDELRFSEMFSDEANFQRISDVPLKVAQVKQKAFVEVNEEGSEAAAVTGIRIALMSMPLPPHILNVDRPFFYKIVHGANTIFSGHIVNPLIAK
ncbi:hypothetical protein QAD02_016513 [Eretmocerus hayati]|uniref:Uncharacterized protein n=1 Tax=Eretmocerus hayati TaxID=131215 RepID=A0ACC2PD50_9HYME|nr:hypothetical protein QAD02_016513 [Eretmocerus hayati]